VAQFRSRAAAKPPPGDASKLLPIFTTMRMENFPVRLGTPAIHRLENQMQDLGTGQEFSCPAPDSPFGGPPAGKKLHRRETQAGPLAGETKHLFSLVDPTANIGKLARGAAEIPTGPPGGGGTCQTRFPRPF